MGGCTSNMSSTILKQYGTEVALQYAQSIIGTNMITQQGATLRNLITQKFNASPSASTNPGLLDQVLNQIKGV